MGFRDGVRQERSYGFTGKEEDRPFFGEEALSMRAQARTPYKIPLGVGYAQGSKKRKLSDWQKFVKSNSKFPRFRYKSGKKKGRINLKALGVAYRKKKRR